MECCGYDRVGDENDWGVVFSSFGDGDFRFLVF